MKIRSYSIATKYKTIEMKAAGYTVKEIMEALNIKNSTSRRLQAKAVPEESVHKKLPTMEDTLVIVFIFCYIYCNYHDKMVIAKLNNKL